MSAKRALFYSMLIFICSCSDVGSRPPAARSDYAALTNCSEPYLCQQSYSPSWYGAFR